jgi:phosphoribosylformylglycinamidine synthase
MAITDNLNFGNPEKPEIMGQIVEAIEGISAACKAFDYPVISGNVSLYNETGGNPILPTPAIGGVGLLDNLDHMATLAFKAGGDAILLLGQDDNTDGWLGQSLYLREICEREDGAPPPVDLAHERAVGDFVRNLICAGRTTACHDLSDGGLLVALAEMALAGNIGFTLSDALRPSHSRLFGEDQGRYLVTAKASEAASIQREAEDIGLAAQLVGTTGSNAITFAGDKVELEGLRALNEGWFPSYMAPKS